MSNIHSEVIAVNKTEIKIFMDLMEEIPDHRKGNAIRHRLSEILTITIFAILCNANTLTGIERFGVTHEKELREFLDLPCGIPSHDTFGDVLAWLDYAAVERVFSRWLEGMKQGKTPVSVALDGKTVRRSGDGLHKAAHIVTAYSSDLELILGQIATEEKSNEITAIPALLDTLDIQGSTVTIDAMGTQTAIADKIIERGADYILALKENQPTLYEDARLYFEQDYASRPTDALERAGIYSATLEKGHGRIDRRECWLMKENLSGLRRFEAWKNLGGIAVIRSTRMVTGGEKSVAYRYYLFSRGEINAADFLRLQRNHWAIENNLHWVLDMTFREDNTHARVEHIAVVLNLFRKQALQLLKHDKTLSASLSGKREICAWRFDLALNVLVNAVFS